jgi:hypothetical protein
VLEAAIDLTATEAVQRLLFSLMAMIGHMRSGSQQMSLYGKSHQGGTEKIEDVTFGPIPPENDIITGIVLGRL